jgi:predicted PhzF superfamily epimerase YddE/YHI9
MAIENQEQFEQKMKRYEEVYDQQKVLTDELEEIKKELKPYMNKMKIQKVQRGTRNLELVAQDRSKIDEVKMVQVLKKRIEQSDLDVFVIKKQYGDVQISGRFYKDGENVVRAEVNGNLYADLFDARAFLEEEYNLTEEQLVDVFSAAEKMSSEELGLMKALLLNTIVTKEVADESAIKMAHAEGYLTLGDIAEATNVNITYALMLKDPKKTGDKK